ncbi:MAG: hypothetical protein IJ839_01680 [Ruminobacter sp.]|nr:hypothetical protein [Ruminobacter sp.]
MNKFSVLSIALFIFTGCVNIPDRNPARFPLHLNTFNATNNGVFPDNPALTYKFNTYSKECALGIYQSADKLADLFSSTLVPASPDYLYLQQSGFIAEYDECMIMMKDSIIIHNIRMKKKETNVTSSQDTDQKTPETQEEQKTLVKQENQDNDPDDDDNDDNDDSTEAGTQTDTSGIQSAKDTPSSEKTTVKNTHENRHRRPEKDPHYLASYEKMVKSFPDNSEAVANIMYQFFLLKDYKSFYAWQQILSSYTVKEYNMPPQVFTANYFFKHAETRDYGYKMLENYALQGYSSAVELLQSRDGAIYRNEHPETKKTYNSILQRK